MKDFVWFHTKNTRDTKNTTLFAFFALYHLRETVPFILQKEYEGYKKHNIVYFLFLFAICVRPYLLFHRKNTKDTKNTTLFTLYFFVLFVWNYTTTFTILFFT